MRTKVIPAQITTVEDTIAGNLNFTQILLLLTPVLLSTAIYALFPIRLSFTPYKIILMGSISMIFVLLSLRVKGRLVLKWLTILSTYVARPHVYIFNKNTLFTREYTLPSLPLIKLSLGKPTISKQKVKQEVVPEFDYQSLIRNPNITVRFRKKGLLLVKNI